MQKVIALIVLCFPMLSLPAQWTNNTAKNTLVAAASASDIQTAGTSDGKTWIAFYSQRGGNYDMRAQLLDAAGNRLLGDSGILVSNRKSGSATFVFNVCVDNNNNFIIAFQVQKGSAYECGMQKISTAGKLLWRDGVDVGPGLSPYPVALSTDEVAVAWSDNGKINYQKVSAAGVAAWPEYKVFSGNSGHIVSRPQLLRGTGSRFNMVYQDQVFFPFYTNLFEQQFNVNGKPLWASAVRLSALTTVSYRYYDVHIEKDTTYVGYFGNPSGSNRFDAYVQKINPDGSLPWGANGSAFSDYSANSDPYEQDIYIAKQAASSEVWAVCTVTNPSQTASSVYVQKYNAATGSRYLGNNAKALAPLSDNLSRLAYSPLSLCGNEPLFLVTDNSNKLGAVKLTGGGNFAWTHKIAPVATSSNIKFRYGFSAVHNGQAVAVWQEDKGSGDLPYAQNIHCDGTVGYASADFTVEQPLPKKLTIKNIYPNPVQNILITNVISPLQGILHVDITDVNGNVITRYQRNIVAGSNIFQFAAGNLHTGLYFIRITDGKETAAVPFNKR